jgi:hypothetical protein
VQAVERPGALCNQILAPLGGTSTTDSPEPANLPARYLPRPPAFSNAQRRLGKRLAQLSSELRRARSCGKLARLRSSPVTSSTAATANATP